MSPPFGQSQGNGRPIATGRVRPSRWQGWGGEPAADQERTGGSGSRGEHMYSDSVLYTIGTALNRAHDNNVPVQILVEGQWLTGRIAAVDGHGVVLYSDEAEHAVIRMGSVSAVRVFTAAPGRTPIQSVVTATPMPTGFERG